MSIRPEDNKRLMIKPIALILAATISLGSSVAIAADCKYKKNEKDPFTDEKIILTKWKTFGPSGNQAVNHGWMAGIVNHGKTFLALKIGIVGYGANPTIAEGAKLLVLMADDSIVELAAYNHVAAAGRNAVVRFELDAAAFSALTEQGATDIRISTSNGDHDFSFGRKPTTKMQFVLGCTQQH